jgi:cellulose synthase/poly-beta-1,6-N-acetylglucosamine synthase-like glycosyltransferase
MDFLTADPVRVTVVVATRNRRDELLRTLGRLTALPDRPPVIVVDNGSADGSAQAAARCFPGVEVVALARNAGAAARNSGVWRARTPYVAFSDDDSWWHAGALRRAARVLDADPRLGLVAARTLVGPGGEPDPVNEAMAASPLRDGGNAAVLGFLACACVVRRAAFLGVGGFSELLFFVGEEQLLAYDLAAAGWGRRYRPDVVGVPPSVVAAAGSGATPPGRVAQRRADRLAAPACGRGPGRDHEPGRTGGPGPGRLRRPGGRGAAAAPGARGPPQAPGRRGAADPDPGRGRAGRPG